MKWKLPMAAERSRATKLPRLIPVAVAAAVTLTLTLTFSSASNVLADEPIAPTTTVTVTSSAWSFAPNGPLPKRPDTPTEVAPEESPPATPITSTPKLAG
jgi:hypothetical protein